MADFDLDAFFAEQERKKKNPYATEETLRPVIDERQGYTPFGTVEQDVDWEDLHTKDDWIRSSQHFFNMTYGYVPAKGDSKLEGYSGNTYREKLADYGLKQMAGFNFNIGDMTIDSARLMEADQQTKESFVYMLDQYDEVNTSWHTAGQAGWEMFTDATNWLGLITLGTSAVVGQGAKLTMKQATRTLVKESLKKSKDKALASASAVGLNTSTKRVGALAGVEGAAHTMASDAIEQNVRIDAGAQEEYNTAQTILSGGFGLVGGAAIGSSLNYAVGKAAQKYYEPKVAAKIKAEEEAAIAKQIDAEKELADARAKSEAADEDELATMVKNGASAKEIDDYIRLRKDEANARDAGVELPEPKAKVSPKKFEYAHRLLQDMKRNPVGATDRLIKEFEERGFTDPNDWLVVNQQINAADELASAEVHVIEGLLTKNISDNERLILQNDLEMAHIVAEQMGMLRIHANAYQGKGLEQIKQFMTYRKKIADAQGVEFDTDAMVAKAAKKYYNQQLQKIIDKHDVGINKALKEGDLEGASALRKQRTDDTEYKRILDKMADKEIEVTTGVKADSKLDEIFLEASISGVFSPSTIVFNTVFPAMKVAFYPMLDTIISDPLNRMAWKKNIKIYSQMQGSLQASLVSARAAARYEQTLLTSDPDRFLEGGVKINDILGSAEAAKFLRFFPRLVGASDAFNQEIAAVSSLAADGFDKLLDEGIEKGLKGKKLQKYIDDNIQAEIDKGYDFHLTEQKLKPVYELGTRKGLAGEELETFVNKEIDKMGIGAFKSLNDTASVADLRAQAQKLVKEGTPESMRLAQEIIKEADRIQEAGEAAVDSVKTLLYKKDFDPNGPLPERMAAAYENWTRDKAWSRAIGNLFFRTPAWLFHESMRLTPAINSILPQFRQDMAGINGPARAARAKTEAAVAYSWMLYVMTKYAEGHISGSPNVDFTKTGEKNKSTMRPLTIKDPFFLDGGKEVSFARWEPLRIPATIVTNALEGYLDYQEKVNMDGVAGYNDGGIPDEIMATFGVGFATAISAIRDSALTQGVSDTVGTVVRISGLMESPEGEDKAKAADLFANFVLDKGLQVVPSSIKKFQEAARGDAPLTQPNTIKDKLIASVNPYSQTLPKRYDTFGWAMSREVSYAQLTGFGAATPEDLAQGRSAEQMEALDYLAKLESLGFGNFTRQKIRDERFPDQDLRSLDVVYEGRSMSLFDAMMQELSQDKVLVENVLFYAKADHLPLGSPLNSNTHGMRVTKTKEAINKARNRALDTVILLNSKLNEDVQNKDFYELLLRTGQSTNRGNNPLTGE